MKMLAFTDIHERMELIERFRRIIREEHVDLAVCAGDFTVFGRSTKGVLEALDGLGVPVVLIHGNHEDDEELLALLPRYRNIVWAHGSAVDLLGVRFIGFGGHGFSMREPDLEALETRLGPQFNDRTIIVCHAPPYGTSLDEVEPGWHVGNESLTLLIKRRRPMVVLCGHVHEGFHLHDTVAGTPVINPGPDGEIIEIDENE